MTIGINATAAVKQPRTGVEEYIYQLIKHLTMLPEAQEHRFLLYLPATLIPEFHPNDPNGKNPPQPSLKGGSNAKISPPLGGVKGDLFDFPLPNNFEIKILCWPLPFLWTQIRLALEMILNLPDVLFIPVHILPFWHPKNSVVTIHGLEYEYFPEHYPFWHRLYLKWSTRYALKHAKKIIAISENTKHDLVKLYGGEARKIEVVYHGVSNNSKFVIPAPRPANGEAPQRRGRGKAACLPVGRESRIQESGSPRIKYGASLVKPGMTTEKPYLLYLGRIEEKKNIQGILEAYKILKEKYQIPHELVLAGYPGYGYENLRSKIENSPHPARHTLQGEAGGPNPPLDKGKGMKGLKIIERGYVSEKEKWLLLANANLFLFPSFYEGFGLPVLEAQSAGMPVVTSATSCLPEIGGQGALYINPKNPGQIAEAVKQIIDDKGLRDRLIELGYENIKRFSWEKCAGQTLNILRNYR